MDQIPLDYAETFGEKAMTQVLAERIGPVMNTFYGKHWDVKSVDGAQNLAYTSKKIGMRLISIMFSRNFSNFNQVGIRICSTLRALQESRFYIHLWLRPREARHSFWTRSLQPNDLKLRVRESPSWVLRLKQNSHRFALERRSGRV